MDKIKKLSTSGANQRRRILDHLQANTGGMTTLECVRELDVLRPGARIFELRQEGHNIITHNTVVDTPLGTHKNARYVLLAGGNNNV